VRFAAVVVSCAKRAELRAATLASLAASDWTGTVDVVIDNEPPEVSTLERIDRTWWRALQRASDERAADFVLMCEDDVAFNRHLRHNLERWSPLQGKRATDPFWATLYFPDGSGFWVSSVPPGPDYYEVEPGGVWGGQAILISPSLAGWILCALPMENPHPHDRWIPSLATDLCRRLFLHKPSLVEHVGHVSTWQGLQHRSRDFDAEWRAGGDCPVDEAA
jgi:hypothetical protein